MSPALSRRRWIGQRPIPRTLSLGPAASIAPRGRRSSFFGASGFRVGSSSARVATWVRRRSARLLPGSEANDVGVPTDAWLGLTSLPLRGRLLPTRSAALKPRRCSRACFYGPAPGRLDSASHLHRSTREPSVCVNVPGEASRSPLRGSVRLGLACNQSGTPQGMILHASAPFAIDIRRRRARIKPG